MTWEDEGSSSGRSFGAGRGFKPPSDDNGAAGYGGEERNGFGGGRGAFGGRRRNDDDGEGGGGGFGFGGSRRGGRRNDDNGEGGGRRGGFGRRNDDDGEGGGFGGGRRGGFGRRNDDDGEGGGGGFGGGRRGGFGRRNDDDGEGGGGFGGGRRGGFGRRNDDDGEGGGGFGGGRRGGFGRRNDDDGEGGRGFGGGRGRNDDGGRPRGGGRGGDADGEGEEKERPPLYIPPEPSNDEEVIFGSGISSGINFDKYDQIKVKVSGANPPEPIASFEAAGLRTLVLENIKKSGYTRPTPVQKYALPIVMGGRDLMACAQTGSGKTAGFLLPIINSILASGDELVTDSTHTEPHAIIVSPTRELTQQIFDEARKFALGSVCKVCIAYGGTASYHQARMVMSGCHILVATPGRLNDFVERGRITFSSVKFVVLDEGDRMLDMGFLPDMEKMLNHPTMTPVGTRQTLLFSATFPEEIQQLAHKFMQDYLFLAVGIVGGACSDVEQRFHQVGKFEKRAKLEEVLNEDDSKKVLVFVETKRNADFIAAYLSGKGFPTTSIHGDREQREREEALRDFKTGKMRVLVATAVAARGLDIKNVGHVVNFDMPKAVEEYVHRIGRTGRVGNRGKATSFYDEEQDRALCSGLVNILSQAQQNVPDWLAESASGGGGGGGFGQGAFGGRDIRRGNNQSSNDANGGGAEEEEGW